MRNSTKLVIFSSAVGVILTGCAGPKLPDISGAEASDPAPETSESTEEPPADDEPQESGSDFEIPDLQLDQSVFVRGIEYQFGDLTQTEPDETYGAVDGIGIRVDFDAYNPYDSETMNASPISLRWDEPDSENVAERKGDIELDLIPGGSSVSGSVLFTLGESDLETFNDESARIIVGHDGEATGIAAIGDAVETVDRFPIPQDHLVGTTMSPGPMEITFEEVEVRWNFGDSNLEQASADEALLTIAFTVDNPSDSNNCSRRGEGRTMFLTDSDGNKFVDVGLRERCYEPGQTTETFTGILMDADYAGTYDLEFDVDPVGSAEIKDTIQIELEENVGAAPSSDR